MSATAVAAGAAARVLRPGAQGDELTSILDAGLAATVHCWACDGADPEQLLCLADLLERRAAGDERFAEALRDLVLADSRAGQALDRLGQAFAEAGYVSALLWCRGQAERLRAPPGDHV